MALSIRYQNLSELIREIAKKYAEKPAFSCCLPNGFAGTLTYEQADQMSDAFALYLREKCGLKEGDRVAVQMPNCLAYPVAVFGIIKAGCISVNTNPLYTPSEMIHQFNDAGARVLVIIDLFGEKLPEVLAKTKIEKVVVVNIADYFSTIKATVVYAVQKFVKKELKPLGVTHVTFKTAICQGEALLAKNKDLLKSYVQNQKQDSVLALQYTGCTTGVSKGAMLTHGNILSNIIQMHKMLESRIEFGKEEIITALPLYHIFAFTVNLMIFYYSGGHNVLIPSPRPLTNLKKAFEMYSFTWITGVNTLFNGLLHEQWFLENPPKTFKAAAAGGTALHNAVAKKWVEIVKSPIIEGYGLTESSPVLSFNPLDGLNKEDSIGLPIVETEMKLVDDNGVEVALGQPGEIIARGPQIMKGYWQREKETADVIKGGWLYTGDVGVKDADGYFKIVDRKKDMILVSGFNVYPNELEDCISKHPKVTEVAVIGVPDEKSGEAVKAFIVKKVDSLTADEIKQHCHQFLTGYKIPKYIEFRKELPKSPVGKILRKDLRAEEFTKSK